MVTKPLAWLLFGSVANGSQLNAIDLSLWQTKECAMLNELFFRAHPKNYMKIQLINGLKKIDTFSRISIEEKNSRLRIKRQTHLFLSCWYQSDSFDRIVFIFEEKKKSFWSFGKKKAYFYYLVAFDDTGFWLSKWAEKKKLFVYYWCAREVTKWKRKRRRARACALSAFWVWESAWRVFVVKLIRMIIAYIIKFHSRIVQCRINDRSSGMERAFVLSNDFFFFFFGVFFCCSLFKRIIISFEILVVNWENESDGVMISRNEEKNIWETDEFRCWNRVHTENVKHVTQTRTPLQLKGAAFMVTSWKHTHKS